MTVEVLQILLPRYANFIDDFTYQIVKSTVAQNYEAVMY